jgi:RNA polymerase sigma-70 factor (ECF subfamily)
MIPPTAWIYASARYRLIDHVHKQKRRGVAVSVEDAEHELSANEDFAASVARKDVAGLLMHRPSKQADAIRLTKLEDHSVADAARRFGVSPSGIKISVQRGLKTRMRLIGEEDCR